MVNVVMVDYFLRKINSFLPKCKQYIILDNVIIFINKRHTTEYTNKILQRKTIVIKEECHMRYKIEIYLLVASVSDIPYF